MKREIKAAGKSHVGKLRSGNEDSFLLATEQRLFAVADGMGGHAAGEVASQLAVEALEETWSGRDGGTKVGDRLQEGFRLANERIRGAVDQDLDRQGMGTTLVAASITEDSAVIANVGDSRAYLLRGGTIRQVTRDHSWVSEQIDSGSLTEDEAARHPYRNIITRALGTRPQVEVDQVRVPLEEGDRLLLCSDGLTGMLDDERILSIVQQVDEDTAEGIVDHLVEAANRAGGEDNITVVLVQVGEAPTTSDLEATDPNVQLSS